MGWWTTRVFVKPSISYSVYWSLSCLLIFSVTTVLPSYCGDETGDCTQELGLRELPRNSCFVHKTDTCRLMSIPPSPPLQRVESEDDAPFEISLTPYLLPDDTRYKYAVNLTLASKDSGVTGFFFFLQQSKSCYNSCRVFDFSGAKTILPDHNINLYYGCLMGFQQHTDFHYVTIIRASPLNQELKFQTYIPTVAEAECKDICDWAPLVLLNEAVLSKRTVDVKFSLIHPKHEIESYLVKLSSEENSFEKSVPFPLPEGKQMHRVVFSDLPGGKYHLAIVPKKEDIECQDKVYFTPNIHPEPDRPTFPWYYVLIFVFMLAVFFAAAHFYFKRLRGQSLSRPKVLILYSEDCKWHKDVVMKLYEFLKQCCSLDAILDTRDLKKNPDEWIPTMVQDVDFIILVVSKGIKHKADNNNEPEMIEESPWGDLFVTAYHWLLASVGKMSHKRRLVKVIFSSYCEHTHVPRRLKRIGKTFDLMKETNKFLYHMHGRRAICGLEHFCLVMPGSQHMLHKEGVKLQTAIDAMRAYQDENPHWFEARLREMPEV